MATVHKFIVVLFWCIVGVVAETCREYHDNIFGIDTLKRTFYCSSGCCGSRYSRYCCYTWGGDAGTIAGIVVGCIAAVGAIVTVIVIIFCCCRKGRGARGQVMSPATTVTSTTVAHTAYPVTTPTYPGAYPYGQPVPLQPAAGTNWEGPKPPPYTENY